MTKFYKYLEPDLKHFGFKYEDGLNIDDIEFNPSGDCEPGGLYYASKDILHFVGNLNGYIAEVEIPEDAKIYKIPIQINSSQKFKADKIIIKNRQKITTELLQSLLEDGVHLGDEISETTYNNPNIILKNLIISSFLFSRIDLLKFLLKRCVLVDCKTLWQMLFYYSPRLDIVEYLFEETEKESDKETAEFLKYYMNEYVDRISKMNQFEFSKLLVKYGATNYLRIFYNFIRFDNLEAVKYFYKLCKKVDLEAALDHASRQNSTKLVKFFINEGAECVNNSIIYAISFNNRELLMFLIQNGITEFGLVKLHANKENDKEMLELIEKFEHKGK